MKYKEIALELEREILTGKYKEGEKILGERKIAKIYNVSHLTVNKAISNLVEKGLLKRVYGSGTYVCEIKKSIIERTIGFISDIDPLKHYPFSNSTLEPFYKKNYYLVLFDINQVKILKENLLKFVNERPKAIIIDGYSIFPFEIIDSFPKDTKIIFINRFEYTKKYRASYILSDYEKGGYISAKKLIENGRRKILILSFEIKDGWTSTLYYNGCKKAFDKFGIEKEIYIETGNTLEERYYKILKEEKINGILSFGDFRVIKILNIINELKLKVPEDIEIIGYYNTPWAVLYNLTSVSIKQEKIIEKVIDILENGNNVELYIEPEIIFRKSCPEKRKEVRI